VFIGAHKLTRFGSAQTQNSLAIVSSRQSNKHFRHANRSSTATAPRFEATALLPAPTFNPLDPRTLHQPYQPQTDNRTPIERKPSAMMYRCETYRQSMSSLATVRFQAETLREQEEHGFCYDLLLEAVAALEYFERTFALEEPGSERNDSRQKGKGHGKGKGRYGKRSEQEGEGHDSRAGSQVRDSHGGRRGGKFDGKGKGARGHEGKGPGTASNR
jgi:hypothetical protein